MYIKSIVLSIFTTNSNGTLSSECLIQQKFELCVFTLPTYTPTQIISFQYSKEYLPSTKVCILLLFMLSKENWYAALSPLTAFIISIAWILFFWYVKYFLVSGCISVVDCFVIFHHFAIENFLSGKNAWKFIVSDGDTTTGPDIKIIWRTTKKWVIQRMNSYCSCDTFDSEIISRHNINYEIDHIYLKSHCHIAFHF